MQASSSKTFKKGSAWILRVGLRRISCACTSHGSRDVSKPSLDTPLFVKKGEPLPKEEHVWKQCGVVLLVDKPYGWTSFDVCARTRRLVRVKKVGHAGTLDPMATGLLVICVGRATKQVERYQALEKEYTGTARLGQATASLDKEEEVCEEMPWNHLQDEDIRKAAQQWIGDIKQKPPMYSAVRVSGKRLYESARKGIEVERKERTVNVSRFDVTRNPSNVQDVDFRIICTKGTYVRVLVDDLGREMNTRAHLVALRRERIGTYDVRDAWTLPELADACREAGISDEEEYVPMRLSSEKRA